MTKYLTHHKRKLSKEQLQHIRNTAARIAEYNSLISAREDLITLRAGNPETHRAAITKLRDALAQLEATA